MILYTIQNVHFDEIYVGETGRRLQDWVYEDSGKDRKSNILGHSYQKNHKHLSRNSFQILRNGYKNLNGSYLRHYTLKSYAPL